MKIAIVTGASSGIGREFALRIKEYFPQVEEIWLVARQKEKLEALSRELTGVSVRCLPLDLCDEKGLAQYGEHLKQSEGDVCVLVNNAGCGFLGEVRDGHLDESQKMIDLNVRAMTLVAQMTLAYMYSGARVINISSIASFCPNPRMTVYSATKAYVTSFSRGLHEEEKSRGISVTAVCPGPMDTNFLNVGKIKGRSKTFELLPYCDPVRVVRGSLKAARRGAPVHTPRAFYKFYRFLAKILPQCVMVKFTGC